MINFNEPVYLEKSMEYVKKAILVNKHLNGDGEFCKMCAGWMENKFHASKIMLTTSCTHGLEMAALLCDIKSGDEVIMPSYTFVSTADAFVLRGAKIRFVDIDPKTMNINANLIEEAITDRTKVIVPVHYAGLQDLQQQGYIELPYIPPECEHNAHMFYVKLKNLDERTKILAYLKKKGIYAVFHYVPLHSSKAGKEFGEFVGDDIYTTKESDRLMRLPMFYGLSFELCEYIIDCIKSYFR